MINLRASSSGNRRFAIVGGLTAVLLCVVGTQALTQDIMKVSPETHSVLLENAQVRVLSVVIKPGEEIGMHSHPANVAYYMTDATLKITGADGKVETRSAKAGVAAWSDGAVHTVKNVGTTELREVQIELKTPAQAK
jgi:quercetin dioxygenase-like cupin family protein